MEYLPRADEERLTADQLLENYVRKHYAGFPKTDAQFNVSTQRYFKPRNFDLINPHDQERILVAPAPAIQSERLIADKLGEHSVPRLKKIEDGIGIYKLSFDITPLIKVLKQAPYSKEYMDKMAQETGGFVRALHELDGALFGLQPEDLALIAVSQRSRDDDVSYAVIPPLAEVGSLPPMTINEVATAFETKIPSDLRHAFRSGLMPTKNKG